MHINLCGVNATIVKVDCATEAYHLLSCTLPAHNLACCYSAIPGISNVTITGTWSLYFIQNL